MYSAQGLLGEVKGARSLNRLYVTFLTGGGIRALILLALPFVLIGGAIGSVIVVGVTCLAAAVFPYRAPEIFHSSPAGRYKIGPVPLVTVMGILGTVMTALLVVVALVNSALGLTSPSARYVLGGAFATGIMVYAAVRAYRRREGVDTSLAFRYVPPE